LNDGEIRLKGKSAFLRGAAKIIQNQWNWKGILQKKKREIPASVGGGNELTKQSKQDLGKVVLKQNRRSEDLGRTAFLGKKE